MAKLEFSLERKEIEVDLTDPSSGVTTPYVMRELTGKGRDSYLTSISGRLDTKGGATSVKNFDGLQAALLSRVLFEDVDGKYKQVTEATIQAWPARIQSALFDEARGMNGLGDGAGEEAGND